MIMDGFYGRRLRQRLEAFGVQDFGEFEDQKEWIYATIYKTLFKFTDFNDLNGCMKINKHFTYMSGEKDCYNFVNIEIEKKKFIIPSEEDL